MDAVLVGSLTALTAVAGVFWWQLMVHPDTLLHPFGTAEDGWFEHHPAAVRALRLVAGSLVFVLGFLTGLALAFLARTG